jgi:hypothetical protein
MKYLDFKKLLFSRIPIVLYLPFELQEKIISKVIVDMGLDPSLGIELLYDIKINHTVDIAVDPSKVISIPTTVINMVSDVDIAADKIFDVFVKSGFTYNDIAALKVCGSQTLAAEYDIKFDSTFDFECKARNMINIIKSFRIRGNSAGTDIHPSRVVEMDLRYNPEIRLDSTKVPVISSASESMSLNSAVQHIDHTADVHLGVLLLYYITEYAKEKFKLDINIASANTAGVALKDKTKPNVVVELELLRISIWLNIQDYSWSNLSDSTWKNITHI